MTGAALTIVGLNHRSAPPEWRERFALIEAAQEAFAAELGDGMLLATCDRIELISDAGEPPRWRPLLAARLGVGEPELAPLLYRHDGAAALNHLFAVASALDSQIIGEPQILGQIKAAHRAAADRGRVGAGLEAALSAAYAAARRVRRETRIAERPVSIAAAALSLARDIHGDLAGSAVLLLGPSEIGALMAEHFIRAGIGSLIVCGPAPRAPQAAARFGANRLDLAELDDALAAADIVIAALASGRAVVTAAGVGAALRRRPSRPIFIVDAGFPPDVEPAVDEIDGTFLYDLGDLERRALDGRAGREAEAVAARRILAEEVAAFARRQDERRAVPAVAALRAHAERLRQAALAEAGGDAEAATRLLINRLLHDPSEVLREWAGNDTDMNQNDTLLRRLFRLGGDEGEPS
ncbi:MAG TPA: glutamyl-tRNA reductase [Stellaceae bacterium]